MHEFRGAIEALRAQQRARARHELCVRGEAFAARHLADLGYTELARNLRVGHDEADLVMLAPCGRTLVVVEVKTRSSEEFGRPIESVKRGKRRALSRAAVRYMKQLRQRPEFFRFDVVEVVGVEGDAAPKIRHIERAFPLDSRYIFP